MMPRIRWIILSFVYVFLVTRAASLKKKIAVFGAGAAGLASAKNALEKGHSVVVYEKTEALGGVWWYTDKINTDAFGVEVHSPMYQGLR